MTSTLAHVESFSDRIVFQMVPQASPGQCGICGVGQDSNGFVDPRLDFEFWGSLIFCRNCTLQMGAIFGLISPEVYGDVVAESDLAKLHLRQAEERIAKLEGIVDGFNDYWRQYRTNPDSNVSPPPSIFSPINESEGQTSGTESEPVSGPNRTESISDEKSSSTSKSSSRKGPLDI